jgi:hypothetical protein
MESTKMPAIKQLKDAVFNSVAQQQVHNRIVQKYKFNYTYTVSSLVSPAQTNVEILAITQDADFQFEKMTGSAYGPCDANGIPTASNTDFPMPGIAAGAGFAGRGLTMKVTDSGNSRELTNGYVPVENLLTPGYGIQMYLPYPIKYFARRNSKLRFDIRNRDTQANARHQIDIAINGYKFQMPEMPDTLEVNQQVGANRQAA